MRTIITDHLNIDIQELNLNNDQELDTGSLRYEINWSLEKNESEAVCEIYPVIHSVKFSFIIETTTEVSIFHGIEQGTETRDVTTEKLHDGVIDDPTKIQSGGGDDIGFQSDIFPTNVDHNYLTDDILIYF